MANKELRDITFTPFVRFMADDGGLYWLYLPYPLFLILIIRLLTFHFLNFTFFIVKIILTSWNCSITLLPEVRFGRWTFLMTWWNDSTSMKTSEAFLSRISGIWISGILSLKKCFDLLHLNPNPAAFLHNSRCLIKPLCKLGHRSC